MERRNWTRQELIVTFNLYCKIPFGRIHNRNPEIIALAMAIGRTPSALSWKLANFARLDPTLQERNIAGAGHGAKLEQEVWEEFSENWERLAFESERLKAEIFSTHPEDQEADSFPEGKTRDAVIRLRVNQGFFRSAILASYGSRCCITGLAIPELLSASHIVPWSVDHKNRTNPQNGLCLNTLHDRAYDRGLLTVTADYKVLISSAILLTDDPATETLLSRYHGASIHLPARFRPDPSFLQYHVDHIYVGS